MSDEVRETRGKEGDKERKGVGDLHTYSYTHAHTHAHKHIEVHQRRREERRKK